MPIIRVIAARRIPACWSARAGRAACVLVLVVAAGPVSAQGFKWWQSEQLQQELQLTTDQVKEIERIYGTSLPERRRLRDELDQLEQQLERLLDGPDPDEHEAAALIDSVEAARAHRNAARAMMLFHIRRVLTSRQRAALAQRATRRQ